MADVYLTIAVFIFGVLNLILRAYDFSLLLGVDRFVSEARATPHLAHATKRAG